MPDPLALPSTMVLPDAGRRLLETHATLLERWRKAMNLVGPGPIGVHYEDSARATGWLEPSGRWVDLGTGAGFPGIVLTAMFPEVAVELVDSRQKRCRFLDEVLATAEWTSATVHCTRHETLASGAYDGVVSRALHAPERMVEVARRLLVPGGTLVLLLQDDAAVPEGNGAEVFHVEHYRVDGKRRKAAGLRIG